MRKIEYRVSWGNPSDPRSTNSVGFTYLRSALSVAESLREEPAVYPEVRIWTREVEITEWREVSAEERATAMESRY